MKNKLAIVDVTLPDWLNQCDGDYLQIRKLLAEQLPPLVEVVEVIDRLTSDKNCTFKQSIWLFEQLSFLPSAASDRRLGSELITDIISKMFMQFPRWVGQNAVINLLSKLKWLPAPVEIIAELEAVYQPVGLAISRAETFKKLIEKAEANGQVGNNIDRTDIFATNSFDQKIEVAFDINRTCYFGSRKISFRQVVSDGDCIQLNVDSRVAAQARAGRDRFPQPDHWGMVDEYLEVSNILSRAEDLGLANWFVSLADYAIGGMRWAADGYTPADVDGMICKSGFAQLMTAFEADGSADAP